MESQVQSGSLLQSTCVLDQRSALVFFIFFILPTSVRDVFEEFKRFHTLTHLLWSIHSARMEFPVFPACTPLRVEEIQVFPACTLGCQNTVNEY